MQSATVATSCGWQRTLIHIKPPVKSLDMLASLVITPRAGGHFRTDAAPRRLPRLRSWPPLARELNFMSGLARYLVLDGTPRGRGLGCPADELADALRAPLATVGVRVVRRRGAVIKSPFSGFQARGLSRRQYADKANQVARIVDEVSAALAGRRGDFMHIVNNRSVPPTELLGRRLNALCIDLGAIEKSWGREWSDGIKRRCTRCGFTRACEEDLCRDPDSPVWESYCPNAVKLNALSRLLERAVVM